MTEAIAIPEVAELVPWSKMDDERRALLKQVCAGASLNDGQFALLCEVALRAGLDPFRKQIYGLVLGGKFTVFTGIDGFRAVARRNGMAGIDAPVFEYIDEQKRIPTRCTITVYRWSRHGQREQYQATGTYREYVRNSPIWKEKPHLMLAKCVEALVLRMAFTETLGGVYEEAEFDAGPTTRGRARQADRGPVDVRELLEEPAETTQEFEGEPEDEQRLHYSDPDYDPTVDS